jgi:hypothetical protein
MSMFTTFRKSITEHAWFNDRRLSERYGLIIDQIGSNFGSKLPQSAGNVAATKGLYRFMNNPKVSTAALCSADASRLLERLQQEKSKTYLAVSDTTGLNYSTKKSKDDLNCLDSVKQKGMYLHSTILLDAAGCPEGLLRTAFFDRTADEVGTARKARNTNIGAKKPIEYKESYRWLEDMNQLHKLFGGLTQHRFVHLCDSEADMYEWYANRQYDHIHYLTRLHHDRLVEGADKHIFTALAAAPVSGCKVCRIKDDYTNELRNAKLELKWLKTTLKVPQSLRTYQKEKAYENIDCYVVELQEIDFTPRKYINAKGETKYTEPLCWRLITSLPVTNLEEALEVVAFYLHRWRVEDYHLVFKEGFEIEELQFETGVALRKSILTYAVVAVQVLRLRYLQETQADSPMEITGVSSDVFPIIATYLQKVRKIKVDTPQNPTVAQFTQLITLLGTGNKKNTGIRALWQGIREFTIVINTYFTFFQNE